MKKINLFYPLAILMLISSVSSCTKWLDVKSKTTIDEEELYSRELGFKESLTGIYINLTSKELYGRELTYGFVDVLAQRYEPAGGTDRPQLLFADPDWYKFPSIKTETYVNSIWSKAYNNIANINNFLSWVEKNRHVLKTPHYYELMKGEAIGLRAYLYFDLLRLYGPIYKNSPDSPSIPYRTVFNRDDKTLSSAREIISFIEKDLLDAEKLLEVDALSMQFPRTGDNTPAATDPFLAFRYKRMNKMAVKALLARVYMYTDNKTKARERANEVINAKDKDGNSYFELVTDNATDRVFSRELIFSISVDKFEDAVKEDFEMVPSANYFCLDKKRILEAYNVEQDGYNDMRIREGQGFEFSSSSGINRKYSQKSPYTNAILNTIPLMRLSEMYYILAECETSLTESANILTQVRAARGGDDFLPFTNQEDKLNNIMIEYRKEFYAEGQLWYFYKRHGYKDFLHCPLEVELTESHYRLSIPENEEILGNIR